ncbi:hypothetical protein KX816_19795 [Sphingosinicellaceae bacterium]|nr:hypothetical protein KX816_19795 [Sphingosinicellaceae bacterium]
MQTRRAQKPITIRSDRAAARLAVLTRGGRSQAEVIEQALDLVPEPTPHTDELAARIARIDAITAQTSLYRLPTLAEFDAGEYDEDGLPR